MGSYSRGQTERKGLTMKLCSFYTDDGKIRAGAVTKGGIVPLEDMGFMCSVDEIIAGGGALLKEIGAALEKGGFDALDPEKLSFANVTEAGKILCVGLNYNSHAVETKGEAPKYPVYFSKFNDSLCPTGHEVFLPEWQRCYDYEAELVIVVGKTAWHIEEDAAQDYIFGYTVGNDLSARDCQFLSNQWLSGKSMPDFAPAGPYIITADSFDPEEPNRIICRVNGEIRQDGDTSDMIFTCRKILADASKYFRLNPGDLIFTGTPAGVILGKPKGTRVWLKKGDTVTVTIEGICTLENKLI